MQANVAYFPDGITLARGSVQGGLTGPVAAGATIVDLPLPEKGLYRFWWQVSSDNDLNVTPPCWFQFSIIRVNPATSEPLFHAAVGVAMRWTGSEMVEAIERTDVVRLLCAPAPGSGLLATINAFYSLRITYLGIRGS